MFCAICKEETPHKLTFNAADTLAECTVCGHGWGFASHLKAEELTEAIKKHKEVNDR